MLRLVLTKLYDGAALLPGKLDERIRRMASIVNGGLTGASLDPAYQLPASRFREGASLVELQAVLPSIRYDAASSLPLGYAAVPSLPRASSLLLVKVFWATAVPALEHPLRVYRGVPGAPPYVELAEVVVVGSTSGEKTSLYPTTAGDVLRRHVFDFRAAPAAIAANEQVIVQLDNTGGEDDMSGGISALFRLPHEA